MDLKDMDDKSLKKLIFLVEKDNHKGTRTFSFTVNFDYLSTSS